MYVLIHQVQQLEVLAEKNVLENSCFLKEEFFTRLYF